MNSFAANAFHESLPNGRGSGTLISEPGRLIFRYDGGDLVMDHDNLHLRLGGAGDRIVFLEDSLNPDWSVYTSDHGLLKDEHLLADPRMTAMIGSMKKVKFKGQAVIGGLVAAFFILLIGVWLAKPWMVSAIANRIPASLEEKMGQAAFAQYRLRLTVLEDEALEKDLRVFLAPLLDQVDEHRFDYQLYIVEEGSLNAFALPGGIVVIHSGTILKAEQGEEVLGVLAHEMGHVNRKHNLRGIINTIGTYAIASAFFGDIGSLSIILTEAAPYLLSQEHSRDLEREADQVGLAYLNQANIDPNGMVAFFERIQAVYESTAPGEVAGRLTFLSTHPSTQERIDYLNSQIDDQQDGYRSVDQEFRQLQQRLRQVMQLEEAQPNEDQEGNHEN